MVDYRSALERIGSRVAPTPDDWDRLVNRRQRRRARTRVGVAVLAFLIAGAGLGAAYLAFFRPMTGPVPGARPGAPAASSRTSERCETLIPECNMERLPNRLLTGNEHVGALGPVVQAPEGVMSFDDALVRAWAEDGHEARAVQVVLGSADPRELNWDSNSDVFYAVTWFGACSIPSGRPGAFPATGCVETDWVSIIDAHTGAFIVGGTA
jgi:hypothetical protein